MTFCENSTVRISQRSLMLLQSKKDLMTMTTNTTPAPTGAKKLPPMMKAARDFITAMEFPPLKKHADGTMKLAAVTFAAITCCNNIEADASVVTGSFALQQVADILHVSTKAVQRQLDKLREFGTLTSARRGTLSSLYTFYRSPKVREEAETLDRTPSVQSTDKTPSVQSSRETTGHLPALSGHLASLDRTPKPPCQDTQPPLSGHMVSYSGSSLDTSLEKNTLDRLWASDPAVADPPVSAQENEVGGRPESPSKTGLIVKRDASEVPPEMCGICKMLNQPSGEIVFRLGTELFCQRHNTPIFTGRDR
jgi:hypothetical protein